jgi:hypothetical protein
LESIKEIDQEFELNGKGKIHNSALRRSKSARSRLDFMDSYTNQNINQEDKRLGGKNNKKSRIGSHI